MRGARRSSSVEILSCDAVLVVTNLRNSRLGFGFHLRFTFTAVAIRLGFGLHRGGGRVRELRTLELSSEQRSWI